MNRSETYIKPSLLDTPDFNRISSYNLMIIRARNNFHKLYFRTVVDMTLSVYALSETTRGFHATVTTIIKLANIINSTNSG